MRRIIAIVDPDRSYAGKLSEYINTHENGGLKAVTFSDAENFKSNCSGYDTRILLIDENEFKKFHEGDSRGVVICLSEDCFSATANRTINKFSRADLITQYILGEYAEHAPVVLSHISIKRSHTIMVYSPVNRCGKTTFSILMSQVLGRKGKCLLIVLDEFSGAFRNIAAEAVSDFSDVIYSYRQGRYSWAKLSQSVCRFGNADYIAPVRYSEDLSVIDTAQMIELLSRIICESGYDSIILDMGCYGKHVADVTEICDEIYMPILNDGISKCKVDEFKESLEQNGRTDILPRIKELELPHEERLDNPECTEEEYSYGKLYDYTRNLFPDSGESDGTPDGYERG